jgi:UDP-N-acetylmuramoylalanine--D-glutamate ligase
MKIPKIAILGFGKEGRAIFEFLNKNPIHKNFLPSYLQFLTPSKNKNPLQSIKKNLWILDKNTKIKLPQKTNYKLHLQTGKKYLKNLDSFDLIFRSPGVPYNLPSIQNAIKKGAIISSATQLFFEIITNLNCQTTKQHKNKSIYIIGITGTKGKGTTSTLIYKMLKAAGKKVYLAGNIGKPAIELLPKLTTAKINQRKKIYIVLELSSFQLQGLKFSPDIAGVLDIFPDHLDAHKNLQEYIEAKASIAKWQKPSDQIFYFADNKYSTRISQTSKGRKIPIFCNPTNCPDGRKLIGLDYNNSKKIIKLPGFHNFKNTLMASAIAKTLKCNKKTILKVIKKFTGNEHRLELVRIIKIKSIQQKQSTTIKFYNDSAATNPQTTAAAIKSFDESKILITGGKDKNLNYTELARALKNSNTHLVILLGENKEKINQTIKNQKITIKKTETLEQAVQIAYQEAKLLASNKLSTIILFSPASASFDMFRDYVDRGKQFKRLVKKL